MERSTRRWLILGIGLCVGLVLFLHWAKFPEHADRTASPAPLSAARVTAPSPATAASPPQGPAAIVPPPAIAPLLAGLKVSGRVFDQASGDPIGAARIAWREAHLSAIEGSVHRGIEATSRADGSFVLDGVPAGRITVTAFATDYAYREQDVVVTHKTPRVAIGLGRGGLIAGQLTEADGTAVAGSVVLKNLDGHFGGGAETSASGEFSFDRLQPGRYRIHAIAGAAATNPLELVLAENERMDSLVLALAKGRSVRGVVRGLQPEKFGEAFVDLRSRAKGTYFTSRLDDKGAFALHGVPEGSAALTVYVSDEQKGGKYQSVQTIDVPADTDLTVTIDIPKGFRLSGRVTRGGIPKAAKHVMASPVERPGTTHMTRVSPTGHYEMEGLVVGEYLVQADEDRVRRIRIPGDTVFDIEIPASQLAGRLLEEGERVPVVGGGIHVINAKAGAPEVRVYQETDHSGQFDIIGVEPGELLLSVYKPGYEMFRERVTYGAPIADMTIRLRRSPGVEISVVDAESGRGIRQLFLVETIGDTSGISLWVRLDERGAGSLPSAFAGSTLRTMAQGYAPQLIREWNAQPIELRLKRRASGNLIE